MIRMSTGRFHEEGVIVQYWTHQTILPGPLTTVHVSVHPRRCLTSLQVWAGSLGGQARAVESLELCNRGRAFRKITMDWFLTGRFYLLVC